MWRFCFECFWSGRTLFLCWQDFINFIPDYPHTEFSQECKVRCSSCCLQAVCWRTNWAHDVCVAPQTKNANILGFCWTNWNEVVFITDQGIEFYQVTRTARPQRAVLSVWLCVVMWLKTSYNVLWLESSKEQFSVWPVETSHLHMCAFYKDKQEVTSVWCLALWFSSFKTINVKSVFVCVPQAHLSFTCSAVMSWPPVCSGVSRQAQPEAAEESEHQRELVPVLPRDRRHPAVHHRAGEHPAALRLQGEADTIATQSSSFWFQWACVHWSV